MRRLFLHLALFVCLALGLEIFRDRHHPPSASRSEPPLEMVEKAAKREGSQELYIVEAKTTVEESGIRELLKLAVGENSVIFYNWRDIKDFTASAPDLAGDHRLVNSYLEGYAPFVTDNIWIPWKTLALRKQYQYDHIAVRGRKEAWQSSREAFANPQGDCEDHAIALADWLIDMGYDARVVLGQHKRSGHAWVVLLHEGSTFLLEATMKNGLDGMRTLPLAALQLDYEPAYMFNRTEFWKNTGSHRTVKYTSKSWVKKSRYRHNA